MPSHRRSGAAALAAAVAVAGALVQAAEPGACPVRGCRADAPGGAGQAREDASAPLNVVFKPGHFVCKSCNAHACDDCGLLLCDLDECSGEFYKQQCWCGDMWQGLRRQTHKVLCDEDCSGGVCDLKELRCRRRQDACKPWWWCGGPPPASGPGGTSDHAAAAALLQGHAESAGGRSGAVGLRRQRRNAAASELRLLAAASANASRRGGVRAAGLNYLPSRFDCAVAALPPKVLAEDELQPVDQGYIILDRRACQGSLYDKDCFCWDNFKYLKGQDPLTSQLKCDSRCSMGPCDGKHCARHPPPPPPEPTAAPVAMEDSLPRPGRITMEPVDEPVLTGPGR